MDFWSYPPCAFDWPFYAKATQGWPVFATNEHKINTNFFATNLGKGKAYKNVA